MSKENIDHHMNQIRDDLALVRRAGGHLECVGKESERGWDFEVLARTELRAALALLGEK